MTIYGDDNLHSLLHSVSLPMLRYFSSLIRKNYPHNSSGRPYPKFGTSTLQPEVKIVGGYGDAHKALIAWMTDNYQARFSEHVKIVQAIEILRVELLGGENARLLQRLECHRFSVDEAGDIHNLCQVSSVVQDKLFHNVTGNFVKGTLQDSDGFPLLTSLEEKFEIGVHRAVMLLERGTSIQSAASAEERWVGGVTTMEGNLMRSSPHFTMDP
jgi:hypothetical protein